MIAVRIIGYGCSSAAGHGVEAFWSALCAGKTCQSPAHDPALQTKIGTFHPLNPRGAPASASDLLNDHLLLAWRELRSRGSQELEPALLNHNLGVILASTKGDCEDRVWDKNSDAAAPDTLQPVLAKFLQHSELTPKLATCISNACSSSHGALYLARHWLQHGHVERVLVIAADQIGAFISKGFKTLKALAEHELKAFDGERTGLLLGEAAAAVLLDCSDSEEASGIYLEAVAIQTEGSSATRPSELGESLKSCFAELKAQTQSLPDLMIAHGTATKMNDITEDRVFRELLAESTPITSTKWSIGHTMGASGLMDLIAACETLKRQNTFRIATCYNLDAAFKGNYLTAQSTAAITSPIERVWISSLGFGGMNAAMSLGLTSQAAKASRVNTPKPAATQLKIVQLQGIYTLPLKEPPEFLNHIDRWYQLDGPALALALAYNDWHQQLPLPDRILLASPAASNETDFEFAQGGAISPAKFVHTLPNVRSTSLLQAMKWRGPVLCLQDGPETYVTALKTALTLAQDLGETLWVAGVLRENQGLGSSASNNNYRVQIVALGNFDQPGQILDCKLLENHVMLQNWFQTMRNIFESTNAPSE